MSASFAPPLITLLTDFGNRDAWVGQLKGAILSVCPHAALVDLTHEIPPGDIFAAALVWSDAVPVFPDGTIHLGVVDPGVGSARRAVAAEIGPWRFVGPDNGLVTQLLRNWPLRRAVELRNPQWWRPQVSPVFHGRDLFGPVAAHWAAGRELTDFGPLLADPLVRLEFPVAEPAGSVISGLVVAVDRFGTLRTNIPASLLDSPPDHWMIEVADHAIHGLSRCFSDREPGTLLALIGSHGHLELAVNQGRAAEHLGAMIGTAVRAIKDKKHAGENSM